MGLVVSLLSNMKTSLKKLAIKYRVNYQQLLKVAATLDETVIVKNGKAGVILLDVEAFERAIADLPRTVETVEVVHITTEEPDLEVIDAEIVSEAINEDVVGYLRQISSNRNTLETIANQLGTSEGQTLANAYQEAMVKSVVAGIQDTHEKIIKLLGK
jgi:DNA-binding IscR family transcriptional regulator